MFRFGLDERVRLAVMLTWGVLFYRCLTWQQLWFLGEKMRMEMSVKLMSI